MDQLWAPSTDHFLRPTGNLVASWLGWASSMLKGLWFISTGINIYSAYGIAIPTLRPQPALLSRSYRMPDPQAWNPIQHSTKAFSLQWRRCIMWSYHIKPHPEASCGGREKLLKNTAEVSTWRQDPARMGNYLSGCSICIGSETYWGDALSPTGKIHKSLKLEGTRSDPTYHHCQWPTVGLCASLHTILGSTLTRTKILQQKSHWTTSCGFCLGRLGSWCVETRRQGVVTVNRQT